MAREENNYTPEFKKEVAQKALDQSKQNLEQLSKEYDVPVSMILMWATELEKGGPQAFEEDSKKDKPAEEQSHQTVGVQISDDEVASSVSHGVMSDKLNYKRLTFWSVLGVVLVIVFIQSLFEMYQYNRQATEQRVSAESGEYYQSKQQKKKAQEKLSSFGVVNLEEGVYRMPIDSVINNMSVDEK